MQKKATTNQLLPGQVAFAARALMNFVHVMGRNKRITPSLTKTLKTNLALLIDKLEKKTMDPLIAAAELNKMIENLNQNFPKSPDEAPYPSFLADDSRRLVLGQIIAFEHYIFQEMNAKRLPQDKEEPLFKDSTLLWQQVGLTKLSPKDGMRGLSHLIKRLNKSVSEEDHYPLPEDKNYG